MSFKSKATRVLLASMLSIATLSSASLTPDHVNAANEQVKIMLDGYNLPFPTEPTIIKGTTLVPFRAISEALGIQVNWESKTKQIVAVKNLEQGSSKVVLTLGSKTASVNGQSAPLAIAPQTLHGTTMIPLSFFSQQFGAKVNWDGATHTVSITSPQKKIYVSAFYAIDSYKEVSLLPKLNSVAFGWSRIDNQSNYTTTGTDYRWPKPDGDVTPESLVTRASSTGTAPYLMVFSGDTKLELTKILENKTLRQSVIAQVVDTATSKQFKGINLDLEGLGLTGDAKKVQADYNIVVKEFADAAHAQGLLLSVELPPLNGAYHGYDYKRIGQLADEVVVMAYAYIKETLPQPDAKVDQAIQLALKAIPKEKVVLGINLFSENANTLLTKIGLAKRYDLKGVAFWRLGLGSQNIWSAVQESIVFTP
ncbi:hypothetical protein J2Z69_003853 [Paenibacillus shirakamiensis]|uniref:GH18 domain-containing protein n=1 Tax=Paenibacillus shirakamiensis TaxID=1265935 RepID=A0ABS4JLZ9_9BACL|nr:stalk domain-containing protein [Paenibacillus shirakamiensis]MBP2002742.1 hypothetical protein [Paenibacillus shirakamiensis]